MKRTTGRAVAVLATVAAATTMTAMSPAGSTELTPSRVTVRATDGTPASGETFRVAGAMWSEGERVPATIRVKTYRNGEWVRLRGAVVHTTRQDRYRIRVVLKMKGDRLLRVVAVPDDDTVARAHRDITVTVH